MREEILAMTSRTQNRIRGLDAQYDDMSVGQKMAYNRTLAELKLILKEEEEHEVRNQN